MRGGSSPAPRLRHVSDCGIRSTMARVELGFRNFVREDDLVLDVLHLTVELALPLFNSAAWKAVKAVVGEVQGFLVRVVAYP